MPKEILISPKAGQEVVINPEGSLTIVSAKVAKNKLQARVITSGTYVPDAPPPVDPPPVDPPPVDPPVTTGILGPGMAADGKDNAEIGRSDNQHWAIIWDCGGGPIDTLGVCWRNGPDQPVGRGYSAGDGGLYRVTLQGTKADGMPDGITIADMVIKPGNTHKDSEDRTPMAFKVPSVPKARLAWVFDNIHADPINNWTSLNFLWQPGIKQPGNSAIVGFRGTASGGAWRQEMDNTPTFQVKFADGHCEGQGYGSIIASTNLDGDGPHGFALQGVRRVRQWIDVPADRHITEVWLRAKHLAGTGFLFAEVGGKTGSTDCSTIPYTPKSQLTGSAWIKVLIDAQVTKGSKALVTFWVTASLQLDVMPIRRDGQEQDGWKVPGTVGYAEKSLNGSAYSDLYNRSTDLQMYLK